MNLDIIDRIVMDDQTVTQPIPTARATTLPALPGKADAVVGMRRSGKTWLLRRRIHDLVARGVPRTAILYVNFEDERLLGLTAADLELFMDALYRLNPSAAQREHFVFLDEVQNVPGWEMFVRRLVDSGRVQVAVTGSSARLLSREVATSLRGRSLTTELWPFSLSEAVEHWGGLPEQPAPWPPSTARRAHLGNAFDRYLRTGGFPEVLSVDAEARLRVLSDYVDVVLFRDVLERHALTHVAVLRALVRRLLGSMGGRISVHRLYNELKSQGHRIGKDLLHEYVAHVEDAFLVALVPIASESDAVRNSNPRKVYLADHALASAALRRGERDVGHALENIVYLHLRRQGHELGWVSTASGFEVDFLATTRSGERALIQVCADLSAPETRTRELRALSEAMAELEVTTGTIVTRHESATFDVSAGHIDAVPAWMWLMRPDPAPSV